MVEGSRGSFEGGGEVVNQSVGVVMGDIRMVIANCRVEENRELEICKGGRG